MIYPLISVIIPNYCHAKYLDQRIQTVLNQTYQNFEVIILDDASPDYGASRSVIEKYRKNHHVSHIVYNEKNSGSTFNQWDKGLTLAKGDYCWIAESDDFCELNLLEELINEIIKYDNIVLAFAPVVYTNEQGNEIGYYSKEGRNQYFKSNTFIKKYLTIDNCIQNASCCIFSRKAAKNVDPKYKKYPGLGDWWLWLEIAEKGNVVIVNKHLSYFRRHSNTVTSRYVTDGTNLRHEKELLKYIETKYWIPNWKWNYIYRCHADSKRYIHFKTKEIYDEMSQLWGFENKYNKIERGLHKILNILKNDYLIRL